MKIGLLGTGPWAHLTHAPALHAHPEVDLVGVWGRRPEAAADLAARFATRAYTDVEALLADCDAVAVALPPDVQAPLAARAARAGCHLLLDKPVATTQQAAEELVGAVDEAGVASVVFFTLRFDAVKSAWIEQQASDGDWLLGRADWLSGIFAGEESPYSASPWRREKGALWDIGPHALSVLLPFLGDVTDVRAAHGPGDTVHLSLRHDGGASSSITVSHTMPPAAAGVEVEVRGPGGTVRLPPDGTTPVESFGRAVDALLEAVRTGKPAPCDVRFGAQVTAVLARAERELAAAGR
jgi:predicted dehydrogenase